MQKVGTVRKVTRLKNGHGTLAIHIPSQGVDHLEENGLGFQVYETDTGYVLAIASREKRAQWAERA